MRCVNCSHAALDHAIGRCMNRTERLHVATGLLSVVVCGCKRYAAEATAPAPVVEPVASVEPEAEPVAEEVVAEPPPARTTRPYTRRMGG